MKASENSNRGARWHIQTGEVHHDSRKPSRVRSWKAGTMYCMLIYLYLLLCVVIPGYTVHIYIVIYVFICYIILTSLKMQLHQDRIFFSCCLCAYLGHWTRPFFETPRKESWFFIGRAGVWSHKFWTKFAESYPFGSAFFWGDTVGQSR